MISCQHTCYHERRYEDDFMPTRMLPDTTLDTRPIKPNKPKKPKAARDQNGGSRHGNGTKQGNSPKSGNRRPTDKAPKADVTQGQGLRSKPLAPARRNRRPTQD